MSDKQKSKLTAASEKISFSVGCGIRTLAIAIVPAFKAMGAEIPDSAAWEFAKAVTKKYGEKPSVSTVRSFFIEQGSSIKKDDAKSKKTTPKNSVKPSSTNSSKKDVSGFDGKARAIIDDPKKSKNQKIRELLDLKYGISQVASALELKYQRVKNVKKIIDQIN